MSFDMRVALLMILVPAGASTAACETHQCTEMGCADQAEVSADLPAAINSVNAELCVNDECHSFVVAEGEGCVTSATGGGGQACLSEPMNEQRRLTITGQLSAAPRDGDVYTLRVIDEATGSVVLEGAKSMSYVKSQPNGDGCPPICHAGSITIGP